MEPARRVSYQPAGGGPSDGAQTPPLPGSAGLGRSLSRALELGSASGVCGHWLEQMDGQA